MMQAISRRTLKAFFEWIESTSGEGWEEACRHQVGQHAWDILEGLPARARTSDWGEDQWEDEPSHALGE